MIKALTERQNMRDAYQQVVRNKGAGGVDHMKVDDLLSHLTDTWAITKSLLEEGKYTPQPIKGVEIHTARHLLIWG